MNKRGNVAVNILVVVVIMIAAFMVMDRFGIFTPEQEQTQAQTAQTIAQATNKGSVATFLLNVYDNQDSPTRYAGTGYCWDTADASRKVISGGSTTLSATAGTTIKPVTVGKNLGCVAFDSTHYGVEKTTEIMDESEELNLDSLNASGTNTHYYTEFYESGAIETATPTLIVSAGAEKQFNKVIFYSNKSDLGFNLKEICIASNSTSSTQIDSVSLGGTTNVNTRPYRYRNTHLQCMTLPSTVYVEDFANYEFGALRVKTTASSSVDELLNVTMIDESHYFGINKDVQVGVEDNSVTPVDVGVADLQFQIKIDAPN